MRISAITTLQDSAGPYEVEVYECENPQRIILGVHGNGVRRWDGEKFYYALAEHFTDSVVVLVDQNQPESDGCRLNSLDIAISRNQTALNDIRQKYPKTPIYIVGHSMGAGVAAMLDTQPSNNYVLVAPAVGAQCQKYIARYGQTIVDGMIVTTSDGLYKNITKEFMDSVKTIKWQDVYAQLLQTNRTVHVFESGADEILDDERFELRGMPFTSYIIIDGASHNLSGEYFSDFASMLQVLFDKHLQT